MGSDQITQQRQELPPGVLGRHKCGIKTCTLQLGRTAQHAHPIRTGNTSVPSGTSSAFVLPAAGLKQITHDILQILKGCRYNILLEFLIQIGNIKLNSLCGQFQMVFSVPV